MDADGVIVGDVWTPLTGAAEASAGGLSAVRNKWTVPTTEPSYVEACRQGRWQLQVLRKSTGERWAVPYRCQSWRHQGLCQKTKAYEDATRIRLAIEREEREGRRGLFIVLTLFRRGTAKQAYLDLVVKWRLFARRLRRAFGPFAFVSVVEAHLDGWPHMNVLVYGDLALPMYESGQARWEHRRTLNQMAIASGFGLRFDATPIRSTKAASLYTLKLSGEVSKQSQIPVQAPKGFRRLRSSRGFLPKKKKDPDLTGILMDLETGCPVNQAAAATYYRAIEVLKRIPPPSVAEMVRRVGDRRQEVRRAVVERFLKDVYGLAAPPPATVAA